MTITQGELFAGISGFGLGFGEAGVETLWHVEIDKACQSVIRRHYPGTDIFADVCGVGKQNLMPVDVITFGSPCQDLSIAGKREGLDGERSGLFFEAARIIRELEPRWAIWENVPGALSSNKGADFRAVIEELLNAQVPMPRSGRWATAGMVRSGHTEIAWRVLDAQYFGVAQRRRRVFLIVGFGGRSPAEVLFERESGTRDTPPSRETGERVAGTIKGGSGKRGWKVNAEEAADGQLIVAHETGKGFWTEGLPGLRGQPGGMPENIVAHALSARKTATGRLDPNGQDFVIAGIGEYKQGKGTLRANGGDCGGGSEVLVTGTLDRKSCSSNRGSQANEHEFIIPVAFDWQSGGDVRLNISDKPMLQSSQTPAIAFQQNQRNEIRDLGDTAGSLQSEPGMHQQNFIAWQMNHASEVYRESSPDVVPTLQERMGTGGNNVPLVGVRRLTPTECERLQGFPDGFTDGQADSTRYRQLGNAVAVPVVEWIAKRLVAVECDSPLSGSEEGDC